MRKEEKVEKIEWERMNIPGFIGVENPSIQHTIKLKRHVVGGDGALAGDLDSDFLETLDVGDAIDEGDENS